MKKNKVKRRFKKWVKVTFLIIISLVIILIALYLINDYIKKQNEIKINQEIPIEKLRKIFNNDDIVARLTIKGIGLDAVITKSTNNVYYLNYDAYKKPSKYGNPFLDYRNNDDLSLEKQINIYGHNIYDASSSNQPFAKLENYLDYNTFLKFKDIVLYTNNNILKYQVYAIKIVTGDEREHMVMNGLSDNEWNIHYQRLLNDTKYCSDDCTLDIEDNILVLQTCHFEPKDSYIIVIAKRV